MLSSGSLGFTGSLAVSLPFSPPLWTAGIGDGDPPWYHWYYTRPPDSRVSIIQYLPRSLCIRHHGGSIRPDLWVYCSLRRVYRQRVGRRYPGSSLDILRHPYPCKSLCFHDCNPLRLRNFRHRLWVAAIVGSFFLRSAQKA